MSARRVIACVALLVLAACSPGQQPAADEVPPTVILISMDGLRWDYSDLTETPSLDALAARGVKADALIPVFPSKTFPSHYSIVTGLHPGNHDIVSNTMRDPDWDDVFTLSDQPELRKSRWWGGEPIWTTANKQGLVTASYFWPGSDVAIHGDRPDYFYEYDGSVAFEDRVDQVLSWLDMPEGERPSFVTLYFAEPNGTSHARGPEAAETLEQVRRVDAMLGRLTAGLSARSALQRTDIMVVSDHGMARLDPERTVVLDDYVELRGDELLEQGAIVQIFPDPGRANEIYSALHDAHPSLAVHWSEDLPERYHLAGHRRLGRIVGIPDVGWSALTAAAAQRRNDNPLLGDHGGDPQHPDIHGIFVAAGPAFARGQRIPPFENVEIYNLLAQALRIVPAPNDGDISRVEAALAAPLTPERQ